MASGNKPQDKSTDVGTSSRQRTASAPVLRKRTYTTNQFNYVWRPSYQRNAGGGFRDKRPSSPNRHHNPHPLGLTRQEPYNRGCDAFKVWNPSMNIILHELPSKLEHANDMNFTAGHLHEKASRVTEYGDLEDAVDLPKFKSVTSVSFRTPADLSRHQDRTVPISRYGSNTHRMSSASGIVPNALRPWQTDRRRKPPSNRNIARHKSF